MNYRNLLWLAVLTETTIAEGPYSCVVHPEAGKFITAMALGPEGHLFAGSEDRGLYRYDFEKWSPVSLAMPHQHPVVLASTSESLWVGLSRSGLAAWEDLEGWKGHNIWDGFAGGRVQAMLFSNEGTAWVGTFGGLWSYDGEWRCIKTRVNGKNSQPLPVTSIEQWQGRLLVGTSSEGVWEMTEKGATPFMSKSILGRRVSALKAGPGSSLWLGCESGLARLGEDEWRAIPMPVQPRTEQERRVAVTPESQAVTCIRLAEDDGLWIGTRCGPGSVLAPSQESSLGSREHQHRPA
ncbi:MAG: hypothetical protein HYU36_20070 [Planctomycetes bacterium]|nr:hypothetical protein [Planctomycetota bacterium]